MALCDEIAEASQRQPVFGICCYRRGEKAKGLRAEVSAQGKCGRGDVGERVVL